MKKRRIIALALQMVVIVVSLIALNTYTKNQVKPTEVYVYSRNINSTERPLEETDIRKIVIPRSAVSENFALNKEDIVGKYVDTKVMGNQYIYKNQLVELEKIDPFKNLDLSRYRKISLPVDLASGISGTIKRGDTVDLIYVSSGSVVNDEERKGGSFNYSKIFMQDVLVYSVNDSDGVVIEDASNEFRGEKSNYLGASEETTNRSPVSYITLAVELEQAEEINTRLTRGNIKILGRFDDSKNYNTLGYVLGDYEKIFSGRGYAETDRSLIEEDDFDIIDLEDLINDNDINDNN